jgi:hypothetical protein
MLPKLAAKAVQMSAPRRSRRPQRIEIRAATGEAQAVLTNEKKCSLQNPAGRSVVVVLASLPIPPERRFEGDEAGFGVA